MLVAFAITINSSEGIVKAKTYSDVPESHYAYEDIEYLTNLEIINGYPDGSYGPEETINRAELVKLLAFANFEQEIINQNASDLCFDDVAPNQWFTGSICEARYNQIIHGYPGTNEFRPSNEINTVEALKIIFKFNEIEYDENSTPWYQDLENVAIRDYGFYSDPNHLITRGEVAQLLARVLKKKGNSEPSNPDATPYQTPEKNLQTIFETRPTQEEINIIMNDFDINYIDSENEKWPEEFTFDQNSTEPSKMVIISHLNVLRQQEFSEPLPFTEGLSIYDYVKKYTKEIDLYNECFDGAYGGGGNIRASVSLGFWGLRVFSRCREPFDPPQMMPYVFRLHLIVHENAHNRPYGEDPIHVECNGIATDESLESGGYSHSALYSMWVYKYGLHDPIEVKLEAKDSAKRVLRDFCTPPTHSNPKVQAIVDELIAEINN